MVTRHSGAALSKSPAYRLGAMALVGAIGVILTALAFEHIGGYRPCALCLQQRYAYYVAIPTVFAALVLVSLEKIRWAAILFLVISFVFLLNAGLGIYHAGAEWKFWPAPETCGGKLGQLGGGSGGVLGRLNATRIVLCDEAPWRFLGLSFAGWNVVTSLLLEKRLGSAA
jgi:disulfide bond formation protein DsbB